MPLTRIETDALQSSITGSNITDGTIAAAKAPRNSPRNSVEPSMTPNMTLACPAYLHGFKIDEKTVDFTNPASWGDSIQIRASRSASQAK